MKILRTIKEVSKISSKLRINNKKVGLVVGSFDVLHMGHVNLFRLAKKHVDILIVGLDNDETIKITKGVNRPINNYNRRSQFLSELILVDYIFKINKVFKHGDSKSSNYFFNLYKKIKPSHIFTHIKTDLLKSKRKSIAKILDIKFVPDTTKTVTTSSAIIKKIESEL